MSTLEEIANRPMPLGKHQGRTYADIVSSGKKGDMSYMNYCLQSFASQPGILEGFAAALVTTGVIDRTGLLQEWNFQVFSAILRSGWAGEVVDKGLESSDGELYDLTYAFKGDGTMVVTHTPQGRLEASDSPKHVIFNSIMGYPEVRYFKGFIAEFGGGNMPIQKISYDDILNLDETLMTLKGLERTAKVAGLDLKGEPDPQSDGHLRVKYRKNLPLILTAEAYYKVKASVGK